MGLFEKLMKRMAEYYAREHGAIGRKWQAMDSKSTPRLLWEARKWATIPPGVPVVAAFPRAYT
jgi:hypothetical protein